MQVGSFSSFITDLASCRNLTPGILKIPPLLKNVIQPWRLQEGKVKAPVQSSSKTTATSSAKFCHPTNFLCKGERDDHGSQNAHHTSFVAQEPSGDSTASKAHTNRKSHT